MATKDPLPDLPGKVGRALLGFWIGFLATLALGVGLYHLLFDFILRDGGSFSSPPTLGLVLSVAAIFAGRRTSIAFEKWNLKTLFEPTALGMYPPLKSAARLAASPRLH